jgi:hypothetical protein
LLLNPENPHAIAIRGAREIMKKKNHDASACILLVQASNILAADGVRRHPGPILRILYSDARWQLCKTCTTLKIVLRSRRVQSLRPAREEELGRLLRSVVAALASSSPENLTNHTSACVAYSMVRAIAGAGSSSGSVGDVLEDAAKRG